MHKIVVTQAERLTEDDRSQAASEQWLARALAEHNRKASPPARVLACLGCGDTLKSGLYCCDECEAAYARRMVRGVR